MCLIGATGQGCYYPINELTIILGNNHQTNQVYNASTKYFAIEHHFIREKVLLSI